MRLSGLNKPDFYIGCVAAILQWRLSWLCFFLSFIYRTTIQSMIIHIYTIKLMCTLHILLLYSKPWDSHLTSIFWILLLSTFIILLQKWRLSQSTECDFSLSKDSKNQILCILSNMCGSSYFKCITFIIFASHNINISLTFFCWLRAWQKANSKKKIDCICF